MNYLFKLVKEGMNFNPHFVHFKRQYAHYISTK